MKRRLFNLTVLASLFLVILFSSLAIRSYIVGDVVLLENDSPGSSDRHDITSSLGEFWGQFQWTTTSGPSAEKFYQGPKKTSRWDTFKPERIQPSLRSSIMQRLGFFFEHSHKQWHMNEIG